MVERIAGLGEAPDLGETARRAPDAAGPALFVDLLDGAAEEVEFAALLGKKAQLPFEAVGEVDIIGIGPGGPLGPHPFETLVQRRRQPDIDGQFQYVKPIGILAGRDFVREGIGNRPVDD